MGSLIITWIWNQVQVVGANCAVTFFCGGEGMWSKSLYKQSFVVNKHHGMRGNASPVLTATGFVNGKWQFLTPYRIDTSQLTIKSLSQVITSATPPAVPDLAHIRPRGASGRMAETP